jgi:hypothetical protein
MLILFRIQPPPTKRKSPISLVIHYYRLKRSVRFMFGGVPKGVCSSARSLSIPGSVLIVAVNAALIVAERFIITVRICK